LIAEVARSGTRHTVEARRDGDGWIVTVDGRELAVDAVHVEGRWSLLIRPNAGSAFSRTGIGPAARSYEVSVEPPDAGECLVFVNGHAIPLAIEDPREAFARRSHAAGDADARSVNVAAPMPGRVVKVLVKSGDIVAARQPLVIIEAMKMENELRAPRAGTVADVRVSEGQSVEAHAVLVILE
jgi:biotin carboxyl carrier protein